MVYVSLFHYTGSGPNWVKDGPERNHCEKGWYYNLLYVNNFVEDRDSKVYYLEYETIRKRNYDFCKCIMTVVVKINIKTYSVCNRNIRWLT